MDPSVGHLNGILARVGGNLNNNFQKNQFDRYISCAMTAKKAAKKFTALSEFLLCLFSDFHCCCGHTELASSLTMKKFGFLGRGRI